MRWHADHPIIVVVSTIQPPPAGIGRFRIRVSGSADRPHIARRSAVRLGRIALWAGIGCGSPWLCELVSSGVANGVPPNSSTPAPMWLRCARMRGGKPRTPHIRWRAMVSPACSPLRFRQTAHRILHQVFHQGFRLRAPLRFPPVRPHRIRFGEATAIRPVRTIPRK